MDDLTQLERWLLLTGRRFALAGLAALAGGWALALVPPAPLALRALLALVGVLTGLVGLVRIVGGLHYARPARFMLGFTLLVPVLNLATLGVLTLSAHRALGMEHHETLPANA